MDELKEQLRKSKLPENVCPVLWKYRYEWSNKTAESPSDAPRPKTAVAKKDKVDSPKNVVAKNVVANGVAPAQPEKKDKKKKEKKPVEKKEEPTKPKDLVIEKKPRVLTTQDLQLEAERARLTQDLEYLRTQHKSALKELQNERERCSSRDERIKRLEEEHGRVRQHSLTLENQLKTDMTWKQAADERTSKLREEIDHIQQQQLLVQTMLKNVSEL
jgi:chromosome segregation ATPase